FGGSNPSTPASKMFWSEAEIEVFLLRDARIRIPAVEEKTLIWHLDIGATRIGILELNSLSASFESPPQPSAARKSDSLALGMGAGLII
ncbi:hypothetical protein KAI54_02300, partial [Candidatus Gracilibacteria bacterium]|nr:hypothetical protein [Candidatus Gracilibacteria bacterium]